MPETSQKTTVYIPVELPAEHAMGPALRALNDRQRAFVVASIGGASKAKAAEAAGYKGDDNTLNATGYRLAHDERIQAALLEETRKKFRFAAVTAAEYLVTAIQSDHVKDQDKIKAATAILDRGGLHALTETKLTVAHEETREQTIARITAACAVLGKDPREFLGRYMEDDVIDVVGEERSGEDESRSDRQAPSVDEGVEGAQSEEGATARG